MFFDSYWLIEDILKYHCSSQPIFIVLIQIDQMMEDPGLQSVALVQIERPGQVDCFFSFSHQVTKATSRQVEQVDSLGRKIVYVFAEK